MGTEVGLYLEACQRPKVDPTLCYIITTVR